MEGRPCRAGVLPWEGCDVNKGAVKKEQVCLGGPGERVFAVAGQAPVG